MCPGHNISKSDTVNVGRLSYSYRIMYPFVFGKIYNNRLKKWVLLNAIKIENNKIRQKNLKNFSKIMRVFVLPKYASGYSMF